MRYAPVIRENKRQGSNKALGVFLGLAICLIIGWLLVALKFIFMPMILAMFATFLLSPPVEFLYRRKVPRPVGIFLTLAAAAAICWLASKYITASIVSFQEGFPKYEERIQLLVSQAKSISDQVKFLNPDRIKAALSGISLSGLVGSTINSFINILGYAMVTLLFLMYFLPAFPQIPDKIMKAIPGQRGLTLKRALESISRQVQNYIWAKTLTSIITGFGVAVPCLLFGVDFAITWGVFAAALNFVPTFGAILSVIPPAIVCALQPDLGGLVTAAWLAFVLTLIMVVTGNVMEPLMLGQSVDLSPTASLVALFMWGWLWGAVGMIIAVPAMAMVKFTCDNIDDLKPVGRLLGS